MPQEHHGNVTKTIKAYRMANTMDAGGEGFLTLGGLLRVDLRRTIAGASSGGASGGASSSSRVSDSSSSSECGPVSASSAPNRTLLGDQNSLSGKSAGNKCSVCSTVCRYVFTPKYHLT